MVDGPSSASPRRTVVLDVATPPPLRVTLWPSASGPARWSSVTRTTQPPAGAGPAPATSPPRSTAWPSPSGRRWPAPRDPRPGPWPSLRDRGGTRGSSAAPAPRVQRHAAPARGRHPANVVRRVGVHGREVAVVAEGDERRGDRGVDGAIGLLRGRSATPSASVSSSLIGVGRPAASLARISSESVRNRLHAQSMASSSAARSRSASGTAAASTTTTAVVPIASGPPGRTRRS